MRLGYIRPSTRYAERGQRSHLELAGVTVIYVEGHNKENIDEYIDALRPGDEACVSTLARLAPNRPMLRTYVERIHSKGCTIVEVSTGRRLDNPHDMAIAMLDAVDELAQDKRTHSPKEAAEYGAMGGRPRKADRLAEDKAKAIWESVKYKRVQDALSHMPGWSQKAAYRAFGARGVHAGRPKKTDQD